jgi:hypothetical protein
MKHFRYSINDDPRLQLKRHLDGRPIITPEPLQEAYKRGVFYYQFRSPWHISRIMRCDSRDELAWLCGQVSEWSPVFIQQSHVAPRVA